MIPRIFPLAALLIAALNPLCAQVSITGDVFPSPAVSPTWAVGVLLTVGNTGVGTLSIAPGGTVTNAFGFVGTFAGSNGTVDVSGGTWNNSNNLSIGANGTGTLNLSAGTVTNAAGFVGRFAGSTGTVNVSGGTWTNSNFLFIGNLGTGTLNLSAGTVTNTAGSVGRFAGSTGTVNVSGGAWTNSGFLRIGASGTGTLTIGTGGTVTNTDGFVGTFAGSNGTVNVSGGSWVNTAGLFVGDLATGTLTLSGTGAVSSTTTTLGLSGGGTGTLNLNGGTLTTGQVSKGAGSGTVTFDGGTLRLSGNQANLFDGFSVGDVTLAAGGGTLDTQTFDVATAYALSGTGALTKTGTGTLTLTGANTHTGGTTISGGILQIGDGGTTGSITGNIINNAMFTVNRSDTLLLSGDISGTGQLNQDGTGTLILSGNNTFTGSTNINAGTLQIGNGGTTGSLTGNVLNNSVLSFNRSDTLTFGGVISGTGQLNQNGPGSLILTGTNTYTGPTSVNAGQLLVNGSLGTTAVTVGNGALLGGAGVIGGPVTILAGGILSPGNSPGILNLGSLTLNPGATTIFEINGPTPGVQHDQLLVTGNASLDGLAQVLFGNGFTPADGDTFSLIQAGSVTGEFSSVTSNLGAVFTLNPVYNATSFTLQITASQQNYTLFALNGNQFNVAANLDTFSRSGQMPELIGLLNTLNAAQLANALQQLSPDSMGAMGRMANHFNRAQGRNLFNRMEEWRDTEGALAGTVSLSSLRLMDWSAQPLYAGTGLRSYTPVSTDSVAAPGWSLFASGTGQFGDIQGNGNGTGYDFQTGGMTVGADKSLGKVFDGDLVAGVYAGYAGSEAKLDNAGGRIDANGGKFGVFGSWVKEGLYVNAQTGGGVSDYDTRRNVLGQRQNGNTTGYEFIAESAIGHEWKSGGWRFGPEGALSYSYVGIDRFTENGGLAPLRIQDQNIHSLQTRLGWRTSYELVGQNGWWLRPGINVSWAHEFLSTAESIEARFASGAGGLFTTQPTRVGRDTAIAGANVTFGQGTRWSAWLAYEAEAGDRLLVHTINAGASIKF